MGKKVYIIQLIKKHLIYKGIQKYIYENIHNT